MSRLESSQRALRGNDANVARAYSMMALNGKTQVWAKFARQELDALLGNLGLEPPLKVIDVGCGTGRHALDLALRGFDVRAFDYVDSWVDRVKSLAQEFEEPVREAGGALVAEWADARNPPAIEAAPLVLCLYDVLGSSDTYDDAQNLIDGLYRLVTPGGVVIVGCMNGMQMLRGVPPSRITFSEPAITALEPVNAMQRSGEVFDFSKMLFNPMSGVLYRREQFFDGEQIVQDSILKERRFTPSEVTQMLRVTGFAGIQLASVRAGKWEFGGGFDPDAPELLFHCTRPAEISLSIPRLKPVQPSAQPYKGYIIELIPANDITPDHAAIVSRIFCSSFGRNPKTGKMHVLGPRRMHERLKRCSFLCLAAKGGRPVGYMFGTEFNELHTSIAWLDSICVVREYRRQGLATAMLDTFARAVPEFEWLGATTPNPITKLVLEKLHIGRIFGPGEPAPEKIVESLRYIGHACEDLRGCDIDTKRMLIKTRFAVDIDAQEREWSAGSGVSGGQRPTWWTQLANLPEDYESLLIIHRQSREVVEGGVKRN